MSYLDNRTILEKADLALADLTAGGGILKPEQAQKFMRLLIKQSVLMQLATVVPMASPKQQISKIKFASRILRPGQEGTALGVAERARPDLTELDAKLFRAEIRMSNQSLEDSIERGGLRQTIMEMMADAISRDMEEVAIGGDTASVDPFLATMDGLLKQTTSNIVDAAGAPLTKDLLRDMLKTLPSEHLRDKKAMRFLTSVDTPVLYSGGPVQQIQLFPETAILLCNPKNIHVGIWRQIRFESARDISGALKVVATLRFDVKFAEEPGVAKAINVQLRNT